MPEFTYIARNGSGEKITGALTAESRREVLAQLDQKDLFPIEVRGDVTRGGRVRRVPGQLLARSFGQLADLLRSGVPLLRALAVIQRQTSHKGLVAVLEQVRRDVEEGATLADAMARHKGVFNEMTISMVRAGGEGGFLEEVLTRVAEFTEAQDDLRKRVVGALAYPMVLATVGTAVVAVLLGYFVPMFESIFDRLRERGELPWVTDALLAVSNGIQRYGLLAALAAALGGVAAHQWMATAVGRRWWDGIKIRLPLVGSVLLSFAVARFCRVLGTLLRNGVPILRSLDISSDATANRVLGDAVRQATENISAGQALAEPLGACGHFPHAVVEMIAVAEESNNLENVLLDVADSLERRTWRQLDVAVRLIEPLLLLVLASVVLAVVVALLVPLLRMTSAL